MELSSILLVWTVHGRYVNNIAYHQCKIIVDQLTIVDKIANELHKYFGECYRYVPSSVFRLINQIYTNANGS